MFSEIGAAVISGEWIGDRLKAGTRVDDDAQHADRACLDRAGQNQRREMIGSGRRMRMAVVSSDSAPLVMMMQSANFRDGDDPSGIWRLDRSGLRAVVLQRQVRRAVMVISNEAFEISV